MAKQFSEYMHEHIPPDEVMNVCGSGQIYMHLEKYGSMFSVDDCSLSDLPEYEEYVEPEELDLGILQ